MSRKRKIRLPGQSRSEVKTLSTRPRRVGEFNSSELTGLPHTEKNREIVRLTSMSRLMEVDVRFRAYPEGLEFTMDAIIWDYDYNLSNPREYLIKHMGVLWMVENVELAARIVTDIPEVKITTRVAEDTSAISLDSLVFRIQQGTNPIM